MQTKQKENLESLVPLPCLSEAPVQKLVAARGGGSLWTPPPCLHEDTKGA